jgi:diacylglycerol O-acyltransferase / wax synthase
MERLSGLDAAFLHMETASQHMHVASVSVIDPSAGHGYSFEAMKEFIASRLDAAPLFRQRLVTVPFGLDHPVWVVDPDFDLESHVRRAALPSPGGIGELAAFAADVISRQLDRRRPLWSAWFVEGLHDDHVAVIVKTHHAAIDGVPGAELASALLSTQPSEPGPVPDLESGERVPGEVEMLARGMANLARQPFRLARVTTRTAVAAGRLLSRRLVSGESSGSRSPEVDVPADPPPAPFTAPRTPLNAAIAAGRRVAFASIALDDVKRVKDAFGVKVNDVVLAVCGGSLRAYLDSREALPPDPLVAFVPISVRSDGEDEMGGNRVSAMLTSLATDTGDPVERLERVSSGATSGKSQHETIGATTLTDWTEFAAPAVFSQAARLYSRMRLAERHRPLFNVIVSNVPGPQVPLFLGDARLTAMYPMGPIIDGGALNITVMSYLGQMYVGLVGDRDAVPDIDEIAAGIGDELNALLKAANGS